jgi:hypothetical protein
LDFEEEPHQKHEELRGCFKVALAFRALLPG